MLLISATSAHTQADAGCCCQPSHEDNADTYSLWLILGGYNSFHNFFFVFCISHLCFLQAQHWPELDLEWLKSAGECLMLYMAHTFTVKSINNFINVVQKSFGVTIPWHLACALNESSPLPPCKSPSMASICSKCCKYLDYYLGEATEAADAVSDQTRITKYETRRPVLDPVPTLTLTLTLTLLTRTKRRVAKVTVSS